MAFQRQRWFWLLPLLVGAVVAFIGWWADHSVRTALQNKLRAELLAALEANVTSLDVWISTQKRLALGISSEEGVVRECLELLSQPVETNPPAGPGPGQRRFQSGNGPSTATRKFRETIEPRMRPAGYFIAQLVATNGQIIADTGPGRARLGTSVNEDHQAAFAILFGTGEPVIITPFRPKPNRFRFGGPPRGPRPTNDIGRFGASNTAWGARAPDQPGPRPQSERAFRPDAGFPPPDRRNGQGGPEEHAGNPPDGRPAWARGNDGPPGFGARTNEPGGGLFFGPGTPGPGGPGERSARPTGGLMQVAAPIRDAAGHLRGAIAFVLNPELEFSRILASVRQGQSGDTYAFDDNGLMLSQSRFDAQLRRLGLIEDRAETSSALTLELKDPGRMLAPSPGPPGTNDAWPLISLVAKAIRDEGAAGVDAQPSRDFRGVPVVGAWRWLTNHQFGVVTQIDATEAYQPLRALRSIFLLLLGLLALAAGAALLNSYWNLTWRRKADEAELKLRILGQYTLEDKIGEGGMGVVHKARHALLRRETAVKLLLPERATESAIRQFEQEVQLTSRLTHPNTIQIYDFGRTPDGIFYYAMEYLPGLNLAELVYRYGPQCEARVLHVLGQACESLSEAHAQGLVHRDIKPANIILCERGGVPDFVKVLDFGLVRPLAAPPAKEAPAPEEQHLSGTPLYLPPECIRNPGHSDPRGDLYALGAVGYHLLAGRPPFGGESVNEVLTQHLEATPLPPSHYAKLPVSPELDALILRCLSKNPEDRPATARDLRAALLECHPASTWTQADRARWWQGVALSHAKADACPSGTSPAELSATIAATIRVDLAARRE